MKKLMLLIALVAIAAVSFGQTTKKDTAKAKPVYEKFIKITEQNYARLVNFAHQYRDGLIYIPQLQPMEKLQGQAYLDEILSNIAHTAKLDSVLIRPKPAKKDTVKK